MPLSLCNVNDLRRATRKYWNLGPPELSDDERLAWYAENLLPKEIECARRRGNRLPSEGCEVLALMLGFSFEPLMQVIAAYRPQEVLLVINARYDVVEGEEFKETRGGAFYEGNFRNVFDLLVRHNLLDHKPIIHPAPISTLGGVKDDDDEPDVSEA